MSAEEDGGEGSGHGENGHLVPVVGIGASAGGFAAFETLLTRLPQHPGIAIVLVTHLSPQDPGFMPSLLSRRSGLEVKEVIDSVLVEADCVYMIPARAHLRYEDGRLHLEPPGDGRPFLPIDRFFRSLAENLGDRAVGVVLSGTGSDGTLGIEAIRAAGGVTFASDEASSEYPSMPRSAAASGAVDFVLPVEEIAPRLVAIKRLIDAGPLEAPDEASLAQILQRVRAVTGHDFAHYKKGTIGRRIERRRRALALPDNAAYARHILRDAEEPHLLLRDLLIGVTSFFRTPEAFEVLRNDVLPELVRARRDDDSPVRVWVAGCSTGHEAYSIAMLLTEVAEELEIPPRAQVFATDIDSDALEVARRGVYPLAIANDVSPDRLRRFFVREAETYRVTTALREKVIFSAHNVTKDPPFSRLDLLVCRNLLIYLEGTLQRRIFPFFHYAVRPGGYLFLGASESVGEFQDLFEAADKKHKIFRRIGAITRDLHFPAAPQRPRDRSAPVAIEGGPSIAERAQAALLARHVPPTAVVNERGDILYVHGRTAPFLELPEGEPSLNLFRMIRPDLRAELRGALHQAKRDGIAVRLSDLPRADSEQRVDLTVEPLRPDEPHGLLLVVFKFIDRPVAVPLPPDAERNTLHLEVEVRTLREALQTTVEDLESANEELTSSNEELLSMNEELQSANEELETSKEEVQSVNEELAAVNTELHEKVNELTRTTNDVTNLLASTQVATLFLDTELKIARYTPDVVAIYNLKPSDIGRPIGDLTSSLDYAELPSDAAEVLSKLSTIERHVRGRREGHFLVRMMPYRTLDQRIDGVVATFIDVSSLERARQDLSQALALVTDYKDALDASTQVVILDAEGLTVEANQRFLDIAGRDRKRVVGQLRLLDPARVDAETVSEAWGTLHRGEVWRGQLPLGEGRDVRTLETTIVPILRGEDVPRRYLAIVLDTTDRARAEEALRDSEARFRALFERAATGIALLDREDRIVLANPSLGAMLGVSPADLAGTALGSYVHPDDRAVGRDAMRELLEGNRTHYEVEKRYRRNDMHLLVRETVSAIRDASGEASLVIAIVQDVTEARRAAELLRSQNALAHLGEMSAVVAHEVRNALTGIRSAIEVIGGGSGEGTAERKAVDEVRARIASLDETVQDLLRFARPRPPRMTPASAHHVLAQVARSLAADGQRPEMVVTGKDVTLLGDAQLLASALLNLCLNAAQALEGQGKVEVRTRADDGSAVVEIVDQGHGVPEGLREQIFEPFFTTRSRGTGLGLPIAKRIIEAHGGSISIEPGDVTGTRVIVRLPMARAEATAS